ncbi:MAG: hypothetical protein NT052_00560 [Candidatus Shapirobacteria bacterium]|nr:hypothetical protein [Candidatus Shapirobacteria bacterium]
MTKYRQYVQKMIDSNKEVFDKFRIIHDKYCLFTDKNSLQDQYNEEGEKVMDIITEWEQRLCLQSEKAGYGSYSANLSEKFHEEIKKLFPMIDYIGLIIDEVDKDKFDIKKIELL